MSQLLFDYYVISKLNQIFAGYFAGYKQHAEAPALVDYPLKHRKILALCRWEQAYQQRTEVPTTLEAALLF